MKQSQYKLIAEHPLRFLLRNMIQHRPEDLPSRSDLKAQIDEALPEADAKLREAIFTKAVELAQAAQARPDEHFDLRGAADAMSLKVVESLEAADRIVPVPTEDEIDADMIAGDAMDGFIIGGADSIPTPPESAPDAGGLS